MANGSGESDQEGQQGSSPSQTSQEQTSSEGGQGQTNPQGSQEGRQGPQAGAQGTGEAQTDPRTGGQTEFTDPRLQGMSPAEIERLIATQEETIRQQGSRLNQAARGQQQQPQQPQQQQQPQGPELPSEDDFWENPVRSTQRTVQRELQEAVAPLREELSDLASSLRGDQNEQQYRRRYADWDRVRPYMEAYAQRQGIPVENILADPGITETVYYAIKGMMNDQNGQQALTGQRGPQGQAQGQPQGTQPQGQQSPAQQQPQQGQQMPQHRPSSAPMQGSPRNQGSELRELTEAEETLRKFNNQTKEEFLAWQEAESRDVLDMDRPGQGGQ